MDFAFSKDQEAMRDAATRLLGDLSTMESVHKVFDADGVYFDEKLWKQMAENGWQGTAIPEAYGGYDMGYLELAILAEEMGRNLACVPFSSSIYMAAEAILQAGSEEQKKRYLPGIASGETIATFALAEDGYLDEKHVELKVENGKLRGTKSPVADGAIADLAVVAARGSDGVRLYVVSLEGVERKVLKSMERSRSLVSLIFNGVDAEPLGTAVQAWPVVERVLNTAAVLMAFEQVGGAQRSQAMAVDYAKERYAFGRPIGSFQSIKHRIADMYMKNELARSDCFYGAWALSTGSEKLPEAAALSRVAACEAFAFAAQENVQVHGGIGFTWQADPHLFLKRAKFLEFVIGGPSIWRDQLTACLVAAV